MVEPEPEVEVEVEDVLLDEREVVGEVLEVALRLAELITVPLVPEELLLAEPVGTMA